MRILVTGATGFVGRHFCEALVERGHHIVAAVRQESARPPVAGVTPVIVGNIGPDTMWRTALSGINAVVHLAARAHVMRDTADDPEAEYRRVNVEATRRLVEEAVAADVQRIVFLSSVKVNGEATTDTAFRPENTPDPEDAYGRTKRDAETALIIAAEGSKTETAILRAPLVYGPGMKGNALTLFRAIAKGLPLPLGSVDNRRSMIFAGNLTDALMNALEEPAAAGGVFFVSDNDDVSTAMFARRAAAALDRPARLLPIPVGVLKLIGRVGGKSAVIERIVGSLQIDISDFQKKLNWTPPFTMKEGLEQTASWYKSR
jgi:nucleoside-diphosphate-sugar epimerase